MNNKKFVKSGILNTVKVASNRKINISNQINKQEKHIKLAKTVNININFNQLKEYKICNS